MSSPEVGDLCEGCRKPNAWMLLDPVYKYVCGGCAEKGTADVMFMGGMFRGFRVCKCGSRIPVRDFTNGRHVCFKCKSELFLGGCPPEST